jgi:dinuclear metal center YbgI/SA1388 family protein
MAISANVLAAQVDAHLNAAAFKDYCPNGLQVENRQSISRVVTGVTANLDLIDAAIALGAQAIIVHHGLFWKGEDGRLVGFRVERVRKLLSADIALLAYHLPLDVHAALGNNAQLAQRCGWHVEGALPSEPLVMRGFVPTAQPLHQFSAHIERVLGRKTLVVGPRDRLVHRIAWCTGAAQSFFEHAIGAGADAFVTGEISEQHVHLARETGVAFVAAGHHATERFGVQALGQWIHSTFSLQHTFVDVDSPV